MATERIKPKGIVTFKPNEKAPSFVKGTMVINITDFNAWLSENKSLLTEYQSRKQLKLQITEGKYGLEFSVDTWKTNTDRDGSTSVPQFQQADETDSLPF